MKKLTLELETLDVVSFEAAPNAAAEPRGTVEGRMATQLCSYNDACPTRLCTDRCI